MPGVCPPASSTKRRCAAICTCEFCYVGDLLNIEGEWRQEMPLETLKRAFPDQDGLQVSLTGGEIFMRKDILERDGGLPGEGLRLRLSDDERHDHQRRTRRRRWPTWRSTGFLKHISVSIDGPGRAARQGARREGHVRAHRRGPAESAGGRRRQACAAARQHQHDGRARNARCARPDGGRRAGTRRRCDRPQSPDVQHARGSRRDGSADRRERAGRDLDVRHVGPGPRRRRACRRQVERAGRQVPRARHSLRHAARRCKPSIIDNYYTPGAPLDGRCLYPFLYARVSFSGKVYFCPFIRVEVGDLTTQSLEEVWTGERYVALRQEARRRRNCSRCAAAAVRLSSPLSRRDADAVPRRSGGPSCRPGAG